MLKRNSLFQNSYFKTNFQLPIEMQQTANEMLIKEISKNKENAKK